MALKSFYALLDVKPNPSKGAVENSYQKVQERMESVFSSSERLMSSIQGEDFTGEQADVMKELESVNEYYETVLSEQCKVETLYSSFRDKYDRAETFLTRTLPTVPQNSKPTVRVTALEPSAWNGAKADFYTWKRKFVHIMAEANIVDELTQLCYLQNSKTLPLAYQTFISDCSTLREAWGRLEERVPKETKYEIIAQFRRMKTLPSKKTPSMLRDFANEISIFCRRMADIGFTRESYSCIIMQDVYERMDVDTTLRYRSKIELKRELGGDEVDVCEDLGSLSDFLRSEATTLELTVGSIELQCTKSYLAKKFNALQNSANYTSNGRDVNNEEKYKCILMGCTNLHKLIDCEKYLIMTA